MKLLVFTLVILTQAYAIDSLLITGFDPFNGAKENNSRITARYLVSKLQTLYPNKEIKFCELRTVYHKATDIVLDCARSMNKKPELIISLGEAFCNKAKLETRAYNWLSGSEDNDGILYEGKVINKQLASHFSNTIDWRESYCKLSEADKNNLFLSSDAGSFVCNETLFNMNTEHDQYKFGFIHVPEASCRWRGDGKRQRAKSVIKNLLINIIEQEKIETTSFPLNKREARDAYKNAINECDRDFYRRLKSSF